MNLILIAIGGAIGSVMRFMAQGFFGHLLPGDFPYGTMLVNISGSFLMGLLIAILARTTPEHAHDIRLFLAVGVLGGYTTFSSFSLDAITLMERGEIWQMGIYILTSVVCSLAGLLAALYLVRVFA